MRALRVTVRALATVLPAVALTLLAAYAATEVYILRYAHKLGVQRVELSDDYGLAFDCVVLSLAIIAVVLPLTTWALWRLGRRVPWVGHG